MDFVHHGEVVRNRVHYTALELGFLFHLIEMLGHGTTKSGGLNAKRHAFERLQQHRRSILQL